MYTFENDTRSEKERNVGKQISDIMFWILKGIEYFKHHRICWFCILILLFEFEQPEFLKLEFLDQIFFFFYIETN